MLAVDYVVEFLNVPEPEIVCGFVEGRNVVPLKEPRNKITFVVNMPVLLTTILPPTSNPCTTTDIS